MTALKNIYRLVFATVCFVGISAVLTSCEKFNEWDVDESTNRLFRPADLVATVTGVTVKLEWKARPNTDSYVIELSKDSLQFSTIVATYNTNGVKDPANGTLYYVIPDLLDPLTRYSARIKGKNSAGSIPESQWTPVTFKTATEQIMLPVTAADLTANSVKLKWQVPNQVTHIMIGANTYTIDATEKAAGEKIISGLTPKTDYTAVLYNNANIRGQQSFKTPALIPTGPNVVVLAPTDDLAAMLATAVSGTTFVLMEGTVYKADNGVTLPDGISVTIWGEEGAVMPVVAFNGITLPANAGTIRFENVDLTGLQYDASNQPTATKRNYIFNQSTASNTTAIVFENCVIRNFVNSPMRMQGSNPITIGSFTVNKCNVYDIGDNNSSGTYAFINSNVATGKINNITLTNSTFHKIGYGLILHNAAPSQTVTIENNTFYNVVGNGRYLIDYNAQTIAGGFMFNNNIIGKTLSPLNSARGIRAATAPVVNETYKLNDAVFSANAIPNTIDYPKSSTEVFTDPANGNFLIKDATFPGKSTAGAPKWRI